MCVTVISLTSTQQNKTCVNHLPHRRITFSRYSVWSLCREFICTVLQKNAAAGRNYPSLCVRNFEKPPWKTPSLHYCIPQIVKHSCDPTNNRTFTSLFPKIDIPSGLWTFERLPYSRAIQHRQTVSNPRSKGDGTSVLLLCTSGPVLPFLLKYRLARPLIICYHYLKNPFWIKASKKHCN